MDELSKQPNIGKRLAGELRAAGILDIGQLTSIGAVEAGIRLAESGVTVCPNKLYALEGAIRGVRWHEIPTVDREALAMRFAEMSPDCCGMN